MKAIASAVLFIFFFLWWWRGCSWDVGFWKKKRIREERAGERAECQRCWATRSRRYYEVNVKNKKICGIDALFFCSCKEQKKNNQPILITVLSNYKFDAQLKWPRWSLSAVSKLVNLVSQSLVYCSLVRQISVGVGENQNWSWLFIL